MMLGPNMVERQNTLQQQKYLGRKEKDGAPDDALSNLISKIKKLADIIRPYGIFFTVLGGNITIIFTLIKYFGSSVSSVASKVSELAGKINRLIKGLGRFVAGGGSILFHLPTLLSTLLM